MLADALVAKHAAEWAAATRSPFLDGVRQGTLPEAAFRHWLAQDYVFVGDLLSFQARLLSIAPRSGQPILAAGLASLEAELGWFEQHGARLGLALAVTPNNVTARYREQLIRSAAAYPAGITSLWTCERAYFDAWSAAAPGAEPYREFVEHWTQPEFADYVASLADLVDESGVDEQAFLAICTLERDFWDMAWDSALS